VTCIAWWRWVAEAARDRQDTWLRRLATRADDVARAMLNKQRELAALAYPAAPRVA
jgi:hypothetical protein